MSNPIQKFWKGKEYNDAEHLGVTIKRPDELIAGEWYARAVVVRWLRKDEISPGNHNLYVDVIDLQDEQLRLSVIRGDNNGIQLRAIIDKPNNEMGTNFAMWRQDTLSIWVDGVPGVNRLVSDRVSGVNTRWGGDVVGGQDFGHVSYYVIFQIKKVSSQPDPPPPPDPTPGDYDKGFSDGYKAAKAKVLELINKV